MAGWSIPTASCQTGVSILSLLALETDYADQAHMTREIQRLAGQQPTALLSKVDTTLGMSDLFKTATD